jgi:multiple sugar transport system permease protein
MAVERVGGMSTEMSRTRRPGAAWRTDPWFWPRVAVLAVAVSVAIFPFYWMARTAVSSTDEQYFTGISLLPDTFDLGNFAEAWRDADLGVAMLNGAIVCLAILVLQFLTVVPAAFAFSALPWRGRNVLFVLVVASLLIPVQMTAVPNYITVTRLGVGDSRVGLVLPFVPSAFGLFLVRQYMVTVPHALVDAARADGLSTGQLLRKIYAPLAAPAIATFLLFSFYVHWNDYLWPLLVVRDESLRTPPLSLAVFQDSETGFDWGPLSAGAAIVILPVLLAFLVARRRFVRGIAGGEVVG